MIADGTEEFRTALASALKGSYLVRECSDGEQALRLLESFSPDVLVLDLMLPGMDGLSILQQAAQRDIRPMVLATTRFRSEYVIDQASQLGVGYLMMKPCNIRATVARIQDLSQRLEPPLFTRTDPKTFVANLLLSLGFPTKLRGYAYLREAIPLMAQDPGQSITKELYPAVAKLCGCAPEHVERSIRSAIQIAWKDRDNRIWGLYFPPDRTGQIQRPTNAALISRLAGSPELSGKPEAAPQSPRSR